MLKSLLVRSLLFLLAAVPLASGAQNIDTTLKRYGAEFIQERLHFHFDKPGYAPGETVWFKAYMMEGAYPAVQSKTVYVDFVDEKGSVLSHLVLPVSAFTSNSQFDIPENYPSASIGVRAYTSWMLNFDTAFLYSHNIPVVSRAVSGTQKKPAAPVVSLQFFPEGGDAVAGLRNKIAFRAVDQYGVPAKIRGVVQDREGKIIDSLRVMHDGMGYIYLTPVAGQTYSARWKDARGVEQITPLPTVQENGMLLQVVITGTNKRFAITRPAIAPERFQQVHLVATSQQEIAFMADIDLRDVAFKQGLIPAANLPSGILTLTLFDKDWNAVAERITFIDNREYEFAADLQVQHWGLNKRAKNELKISIPDSIYAHLSISVTDADLQADSSNNIIAQFFLNGELRGGVYKPAYYFSGQAKPEITDLVMLTHGWRRFKWEDVVRGRFPQIRYPRDTAYLSLSGKLVGATPSQLREAGQVVVMARGNDSLLVTTMMPVKADGSFSDPSFLFTDTLSVYYQFEKARLSGSTVQFMPGRLPALNYSRIQPQSFSSMILQDTAGAARQISIGIQKADLEQRRRAGMLEGVTVRAKQKTPLQQMDERYSSGLFSGTGNGYQFDLVNDVAAMGAVNVLTYLQGRVAGLTISGAGSNYQVSWRGGTPGFYLNEMSVDVQTVSSIAVSDIAYVKVFRPPFFGGFGGGSGGAIAIYTRKGGDGPRNTSKGTTNDKIVAYTPLRQFYSPNYDKIDRRHEEPDLRTTLYWEPNIDLSPNKRTIVLTFFNNDISQRFRVVIEGMTRDGRLTHVEQVME